MYVTIFPHHLLLLHFSTTQLRLGHDWEWCRVQNTRKKGLEGKTGPKRRRFGLFFLFLKEQAPKRRRFGPFFLKKGTSSKTTSFWPVSFIIKRAKTMLFWTQKIKKKN